VTKQIIDTRVVATLALSISIVLAMRAQHANADILTLSAQVDAGGRFGKGVAGAQKTTAFAATSPHAAYGASVNLEFLFLDAWVSHHQFVDGSGLATWTELGVGIDTELALADEKTGPFAFFGVGLSLGAGTGAQVQLPLDAGELTDRGIAGVGRVGFGTHLTSLLDVGVEVPMSYGYYLKSGAGAAANNLSTHYQAVNVQGLVFLRARFGLK
jgi:hypothetical protein